MNIKRQTIWALGAQPYALNIAATITCRSAPSVSDDEVMRLAHELIDDYGDDAWTEAIRRYRDYSETGDLETAALWLRVSTAIAYIQDNDQPDPVQHRAVARLS